MHGHMNNQVWVHNALSLDTMGSSANTLDAGATMATSGSNSGSGNSGGSSWNTADTACTEQSASQMSGGEEIPEGRACTLRRWQLIGQLCRTHSLRRSVELGVREGRFKKHILLHVPGSHMTGVDLWSALPTRD